MNNSIAWAAVEDVIAGTGNQRGWAEVEYPRAIRPGCEPALVLGGNADESRMWLLDGSTVLASAVLRGVIMQA